MQRIEGIIFDKDGTLFDFQASWAAWAARLLEDLAGEDIARRKSLGEAIGYDYLGRSFHPDSVVIAGTPAEIAKLMLTELPGANPAGLIARMNVLSAEAPMVEAVALRPLMQALHGRGIKIGVATNDGEVPARAHLTRAGVLDLFDYVAGFDSGFGAKPGAGMLSAFADRFGLAAENVVMVGDSSHDLLAGRAAGMRTVAVLTGMARQAELAPLADVVMPDIGHLPVWIDGQSAVAA